MPALTVSFCLMDLIFADGSISSTLQKGNCAPGLHVQTREPACRLVHWRSLSCVNYTQSIGTSTLVKLIQIISKLTGCGLGQRTGVKKDSAINLALALSFTSCQHPILSKRFT